MAPSIENSILVILKRQMFWGIQLRCGKIRRDARLVKDLQMRQFPGNSFIGSESDRGCDGVGDIGGETSATVHTRDCGLGMGVKVGYISQGKKCSHLSFASKARDFITVLLILAR